MTENDRKETINKAVKWIKDTAKDNTHGYSMSNPTGPDYKCSTLVFFGWRHAGPLKNENANASAWGAGTAHLKKILSRRNDFTNIKKKVNINNCKSMEKGDMLLRSTGSVHTAQYIGSCKLTEAAGNFDGRQGDSSGQELRTRSYYNGGWTHVYRYTPEITKTKKSKSVAKKQKDNSNKNNTTKRSEGKKQTSKSQPPAPMVRANLNCKEADLTSLEKDYCAYRPVKGGEAELQSVIQNATSTAYGIIGIVSVVVVVIGGIKYMTSAGDPNKVQSAKNTIMYALIGLIVSLLAFAITNLVITAIG